LQNANLASLTGNFKQMPQLQLMIDGRRDVRLDGQCSVPVKYRPSEKMTKPVLVTSYLDDTFSDPRTADLKEATVR
jgi:hypothetical protein